MSDKQQHTPGPWMYGRKKRWSEGAGPARLVDGRGWYFGPDYRKPGVCPCDIGDVHHTSSQSEATQEANARLIAAAPELLEALVDLLRETSDGQQLCAVQFVHAARAAIAKARGES
jgi:hypothetical protein